MEELWPAFQQQAAGRTTVASITDVGAFTAVWRRTPQGTAAILGSLDGVVAPAREIAQKVGVRLTLSDPAGRLVWGSPLASDVDVTRTAAETGLPWTIRATLDDHSSTDAVVSSRRRLFAAGFALMVSIMTASGYFVFRSVNRELTVARLQSDFVAAVSHEFRTPLTAMCHLTEMLEDGGAPPERLPLYYRGLGKETRRLHAMVESLLDFGRIESGRRRYEFSETDATEFLRRTVQEFRDQSGSGAQRVELLEPDAYQGNIRFRADRDALGLALRSLMDNAVKYSPDSTPVTISLESRNGFVGIAVEDQGPGIAKGEHRAIFGKFTHGTAARAMNVKGTGKSPHERGSPRGNENRIRRAIAVNSFPSATHVAWALKSDRTASPPPRWTGTFQ